jgi:hypothetical protein
MIIVIYQAGVGGVSDSEPGAKNGFLGVLALRIYVCTLPPIMDFLPFQNDSTIRSWIDRYLWSIVFAVSASFSLPWPGPSISILFPFTFTSAMLSHWLRIEREVSHTTANRPGYLVHRTFSGMEPDSDLTRSSRLACIAVKLAVRLVTERVLFFVIDNHRLSDYDIEDANVHR